MKSIIFSWTLAPLSIAYRSHCQRFYSESALHT